MVKGSVLTEWRDEATYLTRYAGSGAINTIIGFGVILSAMAIGFSPVVSNIGGYVVGFICGFVLSKKFVFRSSGHLVVESVLYLVAFVISFLFNLLVLRLSLNYFNFHVLTSQLTAAASYTLLMYILTRLFVFAPSKA